MSAAGWDASAEAWIAEMGTRGDFAREFVVDPAIARWLEGRRVVRALDVGCGEGHLCRLLRARGIAAVGIDPTARLLEEARARDPGGDYRPGRAEALAFEDAAFDLVASCLVLIDTPDWQGAIAEMARVLAPGGTLLIVNLNPFVTAQGDRGWVRSDDGARLHYPLDRYLETRAYRTAWDGIDIENHHRPMGAYIAALLGAGLTLTHFEEPVPVGGPADRVARYARVPWFHLMAWQKPG